MDLMIDNSEACKLVEELARLTGESTTEAVTKALRERLDRVDQSQRDARVARLLEIGKDCAARLEEPFKSIDHGDLLYDENGLPR